MAYSRQNFRDGRKLYASELHKMEDGIIEAVYMPEKPYVRAYQWHPERLYDRDGINRRIFADFIAAASKEK